MARKEIVNQIVKLYQKLGGKARKAREIKNFKQDMRINKELFNVALEYVN